MEEKTEQETDTGVKKRLSDADFAAARELYELGKAGIAELSREYGVSRQTFTRRFNEVGAIKGSRANEVADAAAAAAKAAAEKYSAKRAEWIEETRIDGIKSLKQARLIGQKMVVDAVKAGRALGTVDDDLKALGRFSKILVESITTTLTILNADEHIDENELPILTVEDLTKDDILEHHIKTGAMPEDATIDDLELDETYDA